MKEFKPKYFRVLSRKNGRARGLGMVAIHLRYDPQQFEGAACAGIDTEVFYPQQERFEPGEAELLKRVCVECPVMEACQEWGIAMERYGVWGATTPMERFAIRKRHGMMVADPQHTL